MSAETYERCIEESFTISSYLVTSLKLTACFRHRIDNVSVPAKIVMRIIIEKAICANVRK